MELLSAKEVFKKVDPDAKYLFMSEFEHIYWSEYPPEKGELNYYPAMGKIGLWSNKNKIKEFQDKDWQDCLIRKNEYILNMIGKLCWFWGKYSDGNGSDEYIPYESRRIGILKEYEEGDSYPFSILGYGIAEKCEPVQKSELKGRIYNDR